jgi:hypothetical protein
MSPKTKELETALKGERSFSEKQIITAEKTLVKWLHFIIAETGHGKIECYIDATKKIIDINPAPSLRIFKE